MSLDVGGGLRGGGGALSDAADTAPLSPVASRQQANYSLAQKISVSDVERLVSETRSPFETDQYQAISSSGDYIFGIRFVDGAQVGSVVRISKAPDHQRSRFDGLIIGGELYTYTSDTRRIKTNQLSGREIHEILLPEYRGDEIIYATRSNAADGNVERTVDLNVTGRSWQPYANREVIVKGIEGDYLIVRSFENGRERTSEPTFVVAKPFSLRQTPWDGQTVGGVTYSYGTSESRVASSSGEEDEDQSVTPSYIEDFSVITVGYLQQDLVLDFLNGIATRYVDMNTGGRAWATVPVDS